jgi:hypothetical protein
MRALRSLIVFFPLAFLLSWYPYILGKTHSCAPAEESTLSIQRGGAAAFFLWVYA